MATEEPLQFGDGGGWVGAVAWRTASRFTAHVTRDGRFWLIHVPEMTAHSGRHLREIDTMARDLVAVMTGEDPAGIQLTVDIHTPDVAALHLARAAELRENPVAPRQLRRPSFGKRPGSCRTPACRCGTSDNCWTCPISEHTSS